MSVRVLKPVIRFRSEVLSPYQSPPPPYLSRAIPNERAPGGVAAARAWGPQGPESASCTSAAPASVAASAPHRSGVREGPGASGNRCLLMVGLKHFGGGLMSLPRQM